MVGCNWCVSILIVSVRSYSIGCVVEQMTGQFTTILPATMTINHLFKLFFSPEFYPRGGTPCNGLYGEAPPERGTFFRLQVYKRVGISRAEVFERVGKSVI